MEDRIEDATAKGAVLRHGGARIDNTGHFFQPTVLTGLPEDAKAMNVEPFGPLALINAFDGFDDALAEANRLPYGLASYAYTSSAKTAADLTNRIEVGMISINHHGLGLPEHPFGGVKDSGFGSEGGTEGLDSYMSVKFADSGRAGLMVPPLSLSEREALSGPFGHVRLARQTPGRSWPKHWRCR